ncbi:sialic acid-binding Ig-like lectin 10 isoform X1 [Cavia porcellus]|uniref:Ig-like domain-containing protein n=1 Tax=Cavia porcellus TaxID=10141 RepID=H0V5P1_CAVPO|nr:sialic acid-binding Ig-like lectin 10 isoform X1 [Cavia porcellus]
MLLLLALMSLLLGGSQAESRKYQQYGFPAKRWEYHMEVQKQVAVQEGQCVLVPCSFSYPDVSRNLNPIYGYWFKDGTNTDIGQPVATNDQNRDPLPETKGRFQLVGDVREKYCTLLIRDAQWGDQGSYFFRIEKQDQVKYNFNAYKFKFSLTVTDLTQKPDVFMPETLEAGRPVTVFCVFNWNSQQCPAPTFSWKGPTLASEGTRATGAPYSMVSFTPGPQDQDSELTCQVSFARRDLSTQRTVRLSVTYAPRQLVISVSHDYGSVQESEENTPHVEAQKGQVLRLLCAADSRPPATLTWELEGRVLAQSPPSGPRPLKLELLGVKSGDAGRYTCRAENELGSQHRTLNLSVQYPPEDLRVTVSQANSTVLEILGNGTSLPVLEGQSLRLMCVAHSNPPARLSWAWGTQTLNSSRPSASGVLELPRVQMKHEGDVTCHAENPLGTRSVSLSLSVRYAPQLLGPWCSQEAEGLGCQCSSRARPAPSLSWRLGETLLEGNSSNASLTVSTISAGPWANSSLSLHGGLSPGLRLSCEAQNVYGVQSATVLLLPDEAPGSTAFSKGVLLGTGSMALLSLCVILILMKVWRTTRTPSETPERKFSRSSTILEYINVVPKARALAQNQKAKPSGPSQVPSPRTHSPAPKKNQKEQHLVSLGPSVPIMSTDTADSAFSSEGLHYATVNFPDRRPWETQPLKETQEDYAEVKFYRGCPGL